MTVSKDNLAFLYSATEDKMAYFKRDTYEQAFRKYYGECLHIYDEIEAVVKDMDEEAAGKVLSEIASDFTSIFKAEYDEIAKKGLKKTYITNHNSPLVIFVFPGILEYRTKWSNMLCEKICESWNNTFPGTSIGFGTFEHINGGFKTKLCYITTAVCLSLNKEDDCEELKLLRAYRDNTLKNEPDGQALIDEYYDIAPTIVKRINKTADPDAVYLSIYDKYIKKCTDYIKNSRYDLCKSMYITMVRELKAEYA